MASIIPFYAQAFNMLWDETNIIDISKINNLMEYLHISNAEDFKKCVETNIEGRKNIIDLIHITKREKFEKQIPDLLYVQAYKICKNNKNYSINDIPKMNNKLINLQIENAEDFKKCVETNIEERKNIIDLIHLNKRDVFVNKLPKIKLISYYEQAFMLLKDNDKIAELEITSKEHFIILFEQNELLRKIIIELFKEFDRYDFVEKLPKLNAYCMLINQENLLNIDEIVLILDKNNITNNEDLKLYLQNYPENIDVIISCIKNDKIFEFIESLNFNFIDVFESIEIKSLFEEIFDIIVNIDNIGDIELMSNLIKQFKIYSQINLKLLLQDNIEVIPQIIVSIKEEKKDFIKMLFSKIEKPLYIKAYEFLKNKENLKNNTDINTIFITHEIETPYDFKIFFELNKSNRREILLLINDYSINFFRDFFPKIFK